LIDFFPASGGTAQQKTAKKVLFLAALFPIEI